MSTPLPDAHQRHFARWVLLGGLGLMLGAASAAALLLSDQRINVAAAAPALMSGDSDSATGSAEVRIERLMIPVVRRDGTLSTYVNLELRLDVPAARADWVRQREPEVRDAINHVAYVTPLADPDALINVDAASEMAVAAARHATDAGAVSAVRIISVKPV